MGGLPRETARLARWAYLNYRQKPYLRQCLVKVKGPADRGASADEGKPWKGGLVIDERTGVSYPDGFQSPDGGIVVSSDHDRAQR
jgi:hypothetical protein